MQSTHINNPNGIAVFCWVFAFFVILMTVAYRVGRRADKSWAKWNERIYKTKGADIQPLVSDFSSDKADFICSLYHVLYGESIFSCNKVSYLFRDFDNTEIGRYYYDNNRGNFVIETAEDTFVVKRISTSFLRLSFELCDARNNVLAKLSFKQRAIKHTLTLVELTDTHEVIEVEWVSIIRRVIEYYTKPYITVAHLTKDNRVIGVIRKRRRDNNWIYAMAFPEPIAQSLKLFLLLYIARTNSLNGTAIPFPA